MRTTLFFTPAILLGACAGWTPAISSEPAARVQYGDLALDRAEGRAALRDRVATAATDYCARHEREVTPDALRNDNFYCRERLRDTLVAEMPSDVRRAYAEALREAGIRGRRL